MRGYRVTRGGGGSLAMFEQPARELQPHEVRVRTHAVALNYRDLMVARGDHRLASPAPLIPGSDAAGEVAAVGAAVTRFQVGDRVATLFFPRWIDGAPTRAKVAIAPGGNADGVLANELIVGEESLARIPEHLNFNEAATLVCAGVTAWNALFIEARLKAGDSVLLLGTGGVSIWALQLAKIAGLRALITSSSDDKLARARALGADETINYRTTPEWQDDVLRLTDGEGVNAVVEVGGAGTLKRSLTATRMGGTVAIVGGVSGFGGEVEPYALIGGARRMAGVYVGSRTMFEDLNKAVRAASLHPVVDRVFAFEAAREAYEYLEAGRHFGKVVIQTS